MARADGYRVRLRVDGEVDAGWWSAHDDGLAVVAGPDGTTCLEGTLVDQGAVHGLLGAVRDLGLTLVSVDVERADQPNSDC